ncbi:MAG: AAA family ATPase [Gemmataceae bacterium]
MSRTSLLDLARGDGGSIRPPGKPGESGQNPPVCRLVTRRADEIQPTRVSWLWNERIAYGMLSELIGDPGDGKSTITADLAARASRGWEFPPGNGTTDAPVDVLFLSAEDSAEAVIRPRLEAAGADLSRVHVLDHVLTGDRPGPLVLPDHFDLVRAKLDETGAKLIVIDPLNAFISGRVDGNTDQQVRAALLYPLKELAEATGAAVLIVRHLNKGGGKAVYRGIGSIGFTGAVRVSLAAGRHPDDPDRRVISCVKSNIGPEPKGLEYRVASEGGTSTVVWGEELDVTADELLAPPAGRRPQAKANAELFLKQLLGGGPRPADECERLLKEAGIAESTWRRAKDSLKVKSQKEGYPGKWYWVLPTATTTLIVPPGEE